MATVRISKQLIADVADHINKMCATEIEAEGLTHDTTFTLKYKSQRSPLAEFVLWGEHHHLRNAMPESWCNSVSEVDFRFNPTGIEGDHFYIKGEDVRVVAPPKTTTYRPDVDLTEEFIMDDANLAKFPEIKYIRVPYAKGKRRSDINTKWRTTRRSVTQFFESKSSLNKALAEHPSLRLYVPKKYLEIVDQEVTRNKVAIDADALAAQVVALQLRQSTGV